MLVKIAEISLGDFGDFCLFFDNLERENPLEGVGECETEAMLSVLYGAGRLFAMSGIGTNAKHYIRRFSKMFHRRLD